MQPNILLIHADQHAQSCLGAYGNTEVETPYLDALANEGVVYENCFTTYPVCTPSRYSLLTGLHPQQHLGLDNHCTVPQGLATFPEMLRNAGYQTACAGKMHFTPTYADLGFSDMCLAEQDGAGRLDDDYHRELFANGLFDGVDTMEQIEAFRQKAPQKYWDSFGTMPSDLPEEWHSTSWIARKAAERLSCWEGQGNFLMVGFIKPHHPHDPPESWKEYYDPASLSLPPGWTEQCPAQDLRFGAGFLPNERLTPEAYRQALAYYYATITQIDREIGKLIALLKQRGLYDNTLLLYTSDHGDYMGFHHRIGKGNYLYDPVVKLPLLVKYPQWAQVAPGRDERLCSNVDVSTTLLNLAGLQPAPAMQGCDLRALPQEGYVFAQQGRGEQYMVRSKTHKLLLCKDDTLSQLFDLRDDPYELHNRYRDPAYQREAETLRRALSDWILFHAVPPVHLCETAPLTPCENAQGYDETRRGAVRKHIGEQMEKFMHTFL